MECDEGPFRYHLYETHWHECFGVDPFQDSRGNFLAINLTVIFLTLLCRYTTSVCG